MRPPESVPLRLHAALKAGAAGEVPANIALLRLLIEAFSPEEAEAALVAAFRSADEDASRARLAAMRRLLDDNPQAFGLVKSVLADVEHGGTAASVEGGVQHWAGQFDRMARAAPEGAVALYALGNPEMLREATGEVVASLKERGLVGPQSRVLEIGCGIGRFVVALAPESAFVTGLDIAPAMIAEARRRCAGLPNVALHVSSGRDLALVPDASQTLVLAADVFPYLVQAGPALVEAHVAEAGRVLVPGGALAILNFSYRGDAAADERDLRRLAEAHGFTVRGAGERPFSLWDAAVFHLERAG